MKKLYAVLLGLAGVGAIALVLIFVAPMVLTYLAQEEAQELENDMVDRQQCVSSDASLDLIEDRLNVRNSGSVTLNSATLMWRNSTGEYTENLRDLQPGSSQMVSTPGVEEASVSVPGCDEELANYP